MRRLGTRRSLTSTGPGGIQKEITEFTFNGVSSFLADEPSNKSFYIVVTSGASLASSLMPCYRMEPPAAASMTQPTPTIYSITIGVSGLPQQGDGFDFIDNGYSGYGYAYVSPWYSVDGGTDHVYNADVYIEIPILSTDNAEDVATKTVAAFAAAGYSATATPVYYYDIWQIDITTIGLGYGSPYGPQIYNEGINYPSFYDFYGTYIQAGTFGPYITDQWGQASLGFTFDGQGANPFSGQLAYCDLDFSDDQQTVATKLAATMAGMIFDPYYWGRPIKMYSMLSAVDVSSVYGTNYAVGSYYGGLFWATGSYYDTDYGTNMNFYNNSLPPFKGAILLCDRGASTPNICIKINVDSSCQDFDSSMYTYVMEFNASSSWSVATMFNNFGSWMSYYNGGIGGRYYGYVPAPQFQSSPYFWSESLGFVPPGVEMLNAFIGCDFWGQSFAGQDWNPAAEGYGYVDNPGYGNSFTLFDVSKRYNCFANVDSAMVGSGEALGTNLPFVVNDGDSANAVAASFAAAVQAKGFGVSTVNNVVTVTAKNKGKATNSSTTNFANGVSISVIQEGK
jgi:hypothetical protein